MEEVKPSMVSHPNAATKLVESCGTSYGVTPREGWVM
jgi:hypothetical protein